MAPNTRSLQALNSFWHRVCRWVTKNFHSTPTPILLCEACLPPMDTYCKYRRDLAGLRIACAPPTRNPAAARVPVTFLSLSVFRATDSARPFTRGLSSVYLPLDWRTPVPTPPLRKHLQIDALARLTIPFKEGLSRFPLVLKTPAPPGTDIPPSALMTRTYLTLWPRARQALLDLWAKDFPTAQYYPYPPRLTPHPFMGLDQFIAGRIHQMRAGKSYLAGQPSWYHEDPNTTCPCCDSTLETFEHTILHCPEKTSERNRQLEAVSSLDQDSPIWSDPALIHAFGGFISVTGTGFPTLPSPTQSPSPSPLRSPTLSPQPSND